MFNSESAGDEDDPVCSELGFIQAGIGLYSSDERGYLLRQKKRPIIHPPKKRKQMT